MEENKAKTYKVTVSFELEISPDDLACDEGDDLTPAEYAELFIEDAMGDLVDGWAMSSMLEVPA